MTDLVYNLFDARDNGETRHPGIVISELGIIYEIFRGLPAQDVVLFLNCTKVPDELPAFIKRREDPND